MSFWGSHCCYLLRTWLLNMHWTQVPVELWALNGPSCHPFNLRDYQKSWKECESLRKGRVLWNLPSGCDVAVLSLTLSSCDCLQDTCRAAVIPPSVAPLALSFFSAVSGCGGQGQLFSGAAADKMPVHLWRATPTFLRVTFIKLVGFAKNKIKIWILKKLSPEG